MNSKAWRQNLPCPDAKRSGMSAALQTAQAMLESGWGQSIPVDKYNGELSYNLFGIKGTGTAGTVISTLGRNTTASNTESTINSERIIM